MNTEKISFSVANAMQQLCKCQKAMTFKDVAVDKTAAALKIHLNEAHAEIDACLRELGEVPIHTVSETKPGNPPPVEKTEKPLIKAPVPKFDTMAVRRICGIIAMAYPNFCAQTLFDTFQKDGLKPALNYLLNYVAKSNAEITVEDGEDYAKTITFTVDPESNIAKNYKVSVDIFNVLVLSLGYAQCRGSFDSEKKTFSFKASMTKVAPVAATPDKASSGRHEDVVHPFVPLIAFLLRGGLV